MSVSNYQYQSALQRPAVIDIGSNSVRLVIYEYASRATSTLYNEKISCKLGRLTRDGYLSDNSKKNVLETLIRFADIVKALNANIIGVLATAALRDAKDGAEFKKTLEENTKLDIKILSGEEEAIAAAKGVLYSISTAHGIVADLGGGSLELVRLEDNHNMQGLTLPLGVLRLQNEVCEPFDQKRYTDFIQTQIHRKVKTDFWDNQDNLYCVGGSWRALAAYYMYETGYEPRITQGLEISSIKFLSFLERFLSRSHKVSSIKLTGVSKRRISSLPSAALLLQKILENGKFHSVIFTTSGVREGALYDALPAEEQSKSPALVFAQMANEFSSRHTDLAPYLFKAISPLFRMSMGILCISSKNSVICLILHGADTLTDVRIMFFIIFYIQKSQILIIRTVCLLLMLRQHAINLTSELNDDMIFFSGFSPKMQYLAKTAGLAARYLYTASGMSPDLLKTITLEKGKTQLTLKSETELVTAGHNTNKRYDNLNKHIYGYG